MSNPSSAFCLANSLSEQNFSLARRDAKLQKLQKRMHFYSYYNAYNYHRSLDTYLWKGKISIRGHNDA